jgi:hypothetical protein
LTTKMLASTVQFSTNNHPHPPNTTCNPPGQRPTRATVLCQSTDDPSRTHPPPPGAIGFVLSGPNRVSAWAPPPAAPAAFHSPTRRSGLYSPPAVAGDDLPVSPPMSITPPHPTGGSDVPGRPSPAGAP